MPLRVLLFASYAEAIGAPEIQVDLPAGSTVRQVVQWVRAKPGGDRLPPAPAVAVNQEYARLDAAIGEHDEVAIIPPVAGG
jgi:molybdopterin converting factor subunit 1